MPLTKESVVKFFKRSPDIANLHFTFLSFIVFPNDYRIVVADAFDSGQITIDDNANLPHGLAQYDPDKNLLRVRSSFDINGLNGPQSRGNLVHEATHAHLDFLKLGTVSAYESEALAFVAEQVFMNTIGFDIKENSDPAYNIRKLARAIADNIADKNIRSVPSASAADLVAEIARTPFYKNRLPYTSNG